MTNEIKYMRTRHVLSKFFFIAFIFYSGSCEKYLDLKPDKKLVVPKSLEDFQAILDYYPDVNQNNPSAGEVSADDYYVTSTTFESLNSISQRQYTWEKDFLFEPNYNDWESVYKIIYRSNTVLNNIDGVQRTDINGLTWDNIKGQALFHRANSYFQAAVIWCVAYDRNSSTTDLGLPLRLNTDFNEQSVRSSLEDTYTQIIFDLKQAIPLLLKAQIHPVRPNKGAAYGLLARVYLAMREYDSAGRYADSALKLNNALLDLNTLTISPTSSQYPIPRYFDNPEVFFSSRIATPSILLNSRAKIDSNLYNSYNLDDRRRLIFFKTNTGSNAGTFGFRGSYEKGATLFQGIATDEMYLIRAESFARQGDAQRAIDDLNTLLIARWNTGTFSPYDTTDPNVALNLVLTERRKELLMRGLRWMDIKRLNKEGANISLKRIINGTNYSLPAGDLRFALAIPEDVITLSNITQNPR